MGAVSPFHPVIGTNFSVSTLWRYTDFTAIRCVSKTYNFYFLLLVLALDWLLQTTWLRHPVVAEEGQSQWLMDIQFESDRLETEQRVISHCLWLGQQHSGDLFQINVRKTGELNLGRPLSPSAPTNPNSLLLSLCLPCSLLLYLGVSLAFCHWTPHKGDFSFCKLKERKEKWRRTGWRDGAVLQL